MEELHPGFALCRRSRSSARGGGFTLVELLLVLVILMLVLGAVVFSFETARQGVELEEAGRRWESVVRAVRAEAASRGRRMRMEFQAVEVATNAVQSVREGGRKVQVLWEAKPLEQPGEFAAVPGHIMDLAEVNELGWVMEARRGGGHFSRSEGMEERAESDERDWVAEREGGEELERAFESILFYPDGSSDLAEILLKSADLDDEREMVVRLGWVGVSSSMVERNDD